MSGFSFGAAVTPQQQQQGAPLFGTPLASSTPAQGFGGAGVKTATPAWVTPFGTSGTTTTTSTAASIAPTTGFSFSNPTATSGGIGGLQQPQQQSVGFSLGGTTGGLGGLGTAATTSAAGGGFSFGTSLGAAQAPVSTSATQQQQQPSTTTSSFGGLGGIPSTAGPRLSTLALGSDPGTGWSTRNDNRAVQELPVPPEILAAVEELKNQMKNHKSMMMDINRNFDLDIDLVAEQIEEVRMGLTNLANIMHRQELQSASLIKDMQELSKDMDLLSQARDVPAYGYGGTSSLLHNFLYELIDKYSARMMKYKVEIERAEFALQTIVGAYNVNAKDLWASLTSIKDTVILLAAQIQQLHEDVRNELGVHKNISQVLYGTSPKPWLANAISGNPQINQNAPPLERVLSTPSKFTGGANAAASLESVYQRTYSMLHRVPAHADARGLLAAPASAAEALMRTPAYDPRSSTNMGLSASMMGSYIGSSSPGASASLKRSKK